MKTRILYTIVLLTIFSFGAFAQGITNDGAVITIDVGTQIVVTNGGYYNLTNAVSGNHGQIDLNGGLRLTGDFENNVTDADQHVFINVGIDGYVVMNGSSDQNISNSTANAYIDFERLYIFSGSNTMLDAGSAATIQGTFYVQDGSTFRLSSPTDGEGPSGSLITLGSVTGSGAGALWVDRHYETAGRYVYFSAPVDNATDDMFDNTYLPNNFNPNIYSYNEGYDADPDPTNTNYSNWSDPTYAFYDAWIQVADEPTTVALSGDGAGYITYNETELDIEYGGHYSNLNNAASYSPTVTFDGNDGNGYYYDGWNLVGNPYPCPIDWDDANWTKTNIADAVYLWDGDNENFVYYGTGSVSGVGQTLNSDANARYIPAMQSFMVKATAAGPSLIIPDDARVHYQNDMYKNGENKITEFEYLKLRTEHDGFYDETIVRFLEGATPEVDGDFDAYKMFPWSTPAMIYSIAINPETPVAINSLPISTIGTTVPLGFLTEEAGSYSISVKEFNFDLTTEVTLIDTYLDTETILDEDIEYSFTYDGGESRDRFYLFVAPEGGLDIEDPQEDFETSVNVWSAENNIYISISSYELIDARVEIFDVLGKSVIQKRLTGTYNVVNVPGASGTYFVKLRTKDGTLRTDKVFIQK